MTTTPDSGRLAAVRRAATKWREQLMSGQTSSQLSRFQDYRGSTLDLTPGQGRDISIPALNKLLSGVPTRLSEFFGDSQLLDDARKRAATISRSAAQLREDKGIDTLYLALGLATWHVDSGAPYRAPVAVIPLRIAPQGNARQDFDLEASVYEASINLLLDQRFRSDFQVAARASEDGLVEALSIDPRIRRLLSLRRALMDEWAKVPELKIEIKAVVGIFKYANLPMVTDLSEENLEQIAQNNFVAAMAGWEPAQQVLREKIAEPPLNKPDSDPPQSEYLILDADSSQNHAINRVLAGESLVIWGPPGTGKSQTIANLIASLIAQGKRVLFVAQKRAAIDVVHQRLENVGLADLAMDVHGGFSSKREFWQDMGRALTAYQNTPAENQTALHERLASARETLKRHDDMLHGVRSWGVSLYKMQVRLTEIGPQAQTAVRLDWNSPQSRTVDDIRGIRQHIEEYVNLGGLTLALEHPEWAASSIRTADEAERAWNAADALAGLIPQTEILLRDAGLKPSAFPSNWRIVVKLLQDVRQLELKYGSGIYVLDHASIQKRLEPFDQHGDDLGSADVERLLREILPACTLALNHLREAGVSPPPNISEWPNVPRLLEGISALCNEFTPGILEIDHQAVVADLGPARRFPTRSVAFLFPRYRRAKRMLDGLRNGRKPLSGGDYLNAVEKAAKYVGDWRALNQDNSVPKNPPNLDRISKFVDSFICSVRELGDLLNKQEIKRLPYGELPDFAQPLLDCLDTWHSTRDNHLPQLDIGGAEVLAAIVTAQRHVEVWRDICSEDGPPRPAPSLANIQTNVQDGLQYLAELGECLNVDLTQRPIDELHRLVNRLAATQNVAGSLPLLHQLEDYFAEQKIANFMGRIKQDVSPNLLGDAVEWAWLQALLRHLEFQDSELANFSESALSQAREQFMLNDSEHFVKTPTRIKRAVAVAATEAMNDLPVEAQRIRGQAGRQRGHVSPRSAFQSAASEVLISLRPAWMISPLMVAEMLPATQELFDVLIFDEASQIPPEEAIGSLARAKQVVVAGDNRQLPPTDFFRQAHIDDSDGDTDDDDEIDSLPATDIAAFESILDVFSNDLPIQSRMLQWHYRSRDSRLIAFSNEHLYEGTLTTFPGTREEGPLTHHLVPHRTLTGVNQRSNSSHPDEVNRVIDLVLEHARTRPNESLGVIAFGQDHADKIQEALDNRRIALLDQTAETFFEGQATEPFFIKNIERVQGDEREVIILSVGYHKNNDGRLLYRFGPLTYQGGERRLNVAISRARSHLHLVSSFSHLDMEPGRSKARGVELLRQYLEYVSSGGRELGREHASHPLNPFELDVKVGLEERGIPLTPQYGVSGYRIDFALAHPDRPGQFVLAVEADGDSYHSLPTVRDRDRLRQRVLEDKGWRFYRLSSTAWSRDRQAELDKIESAWRQAVDAIDNAVAPEPDQGRSGVSPVEKDELSAPPPQRRGPRPSIPKRKNIDEYSDSELTQLLRWIELDTLLRPEQELKQEMTRELGFKKLGSRIDAALSRVIKNVRGRPSSGQS